MIHLKFNYFYLIALLLCNNLETFDHNEIKRQNFTTDAIAPENKDFLLGAGIWHTDYEENPSIPTDWDASFFKKYSGKDLPSRKDASNAEKDGLQIVDEINNLGCNLTIISIRQNPDQQAELQRVKSLIEKAQNHGMKIMLCLQGYLNRPEFTDKGGFTRKENIEELITYHKSFIESFANDVDYWLPVYQPVSYATKAYVMGMQPPYQTNNPLNISNNYYEAIKNQVAFHIQIADEIRTTYKDKKIQHQPQIGICHQVMEMKAHNQYNPLEQAAAWAADRLQNKPFEVFTDGRLRSIFPKIDAAVIDQARNSYDFVLAFHCSDMAFKQENWNPASIRPTIPADANPELITQNGFRVANAKSAKHAMEKAGELSGNKDIFFMFGINTQDSNQRIQAHNEIISGIIAAKNKDKFKGFILSNIRDFDTEMVSKNFNPEKDTTTTGDFGWYDKNGNAKKEVAYLQKISKKQFENNN
ncbi:MAG: family 1 glycosylhydrolase [Candidatus Chromulinivorax sp.]